MQPEKTHLEDVADKAHEYLNTRLDIGKLKAMEYGAVAFAAVLGRLILLMIGFCALIFASIALAIYLSVITRNVWMGCLIVSGLYLLLILILKLNKKRLLDTPLANIFILQFHKKDEN